jgi:hypothetical protein
MVSASRMILNKSRRDTSILHYAFCILHSPPKRTFLFAVLYDIMEERM